jgi:hypothetical protein
MNSGGGGKASRVTQGTQGRGTGVPAGTGLLPNSPLRATCPKCEAGVGRKCVKTDRYGMESSRTAVHPERTAAAREVYAGPLRRRKPRS